MLHHLKRFYRGLKHPGRVKEIYHAYLATRQWWQLTLAFIGIGKLNYPFTLLLHKKITIELNNWHDLVTAWIIFFRKEYEVPPDAKVIIDAGANIGCFSIYAAWKAPQAQIYALEPFPATIAAFKKNILANGLENKVQLQEIALSDRNGQEFMGQEDHTPSQSLGLLEHTHENALAVKTMTITKFFETFQIESVDLFKMDIEGAKHKVLPATSPEIFHRIERFSLEFHPNGERKKLFELLKANGLILNHLTRSSQNSGVAWFSRSIEHQSLPTL